MSSLAQCRVTCNCEYREHGSLQNEFWMVLLDERVLRLGFPLRPRRRSPLYYSLIAKVTLANSHSFTFLFLISVGTTRSSFFFFFFVCRLFSSGNFRLIAVASSICRKLQARACDGAVASGSGRGLNSYWCITWIARVGWDLGSSILLLSVSSFIVTRGSQSSVSLIHMTRIFPPNFALPLIIYSLTSLLTTPGADSGKDLFFYFHLPLQLNSVSPALPSC